MSLTLEADLGLEARAIQHLIGERKALTSRISYEEARLKINEQRFRPVQSPTTTVKSPSIPHGDRFPDVSSFQPHVDLGAVRKAPDRFGELIVVKATEGLDYVDGYLASRWHQAHEMGFPHRGAYHFLHPGLGGAAQAEYMLHALEQDGRTVTAQDILICDAEVSDGEAPGTVLKAVNDFGTKLAQECPAKRWLYTGGPFAREFGLSLAHYNGHWLPAYTGDPKPYYVFGTPIAWQYTDGYHGPTPHTVDGIGTCDCSIIL